ncbi:MAG: lipopolysaccharide biosynthesis protein [Planctomycetes bacterium]|nr:lipopolysaccharide biosynthesis protein [Planctomycetota bacterium]
MSRHIRHTLLALASGALIQRVALLISTLIVARALDLAELGLLAIGLQAGRLLGLLADAGPRAIAAREAAHRPRAEALAWIAAARRASLPIALALTAVWALAVLALAPERPVFWLLCGALAVPTARDLKGLADALGSTRVEVRLENLCTLALLAGTLLAWRLELLGAEMLAALNVGSRLLYALLGELWLARRGAPVERVSLRAAHGRLHLLSIAQVANQAIFSSDVILLGLLGRAEAAGLYHAAQRIAQAAELPLGLLARAVQPHLAAAASGGDARGALERIVRASAFLVLPVAAGGWVVAEPLLHRLFGARFEAAAWTLRWLLLAAVAIHVGSRYGNLLFARKEHRPYLRSIGLGAGLNLALSLLWIPGYGASGTALATAIGACAAALCAAIELHRRLRFDVIAPYPRPLLLAVAVALAALAVPTEIGVLVRVGAGAVVFAIGLYLLELRRGLRHVGSGLVRASGFDRAS